jgi:hypothetical protein
VNISAVLEITFTAFKVITAVLKSFSQKHFKKKPCRFWERLKAEGRKLDRQPDGGGYTDAEKAVSYQKGLISVGEANVST